jgi:hypothetical protein
MMRVLDSAEALAPSSKLDRAAVSCLLLDSVIEEAERSPLGLVTREPESEPSESRRPGAQ